MEDVLIVLIIFGALFGVIYIFVTARNKERMALIEKNADAKIFYPERRTGNYGKVVIKLGMFAMGIGLGIFIGYLLHNAFMLDVEASYTSMIFLFGGAGLFASYFVARKTNGAK